jgi:hypothetical protein
MKQRGRKSAKSEEVSHKVVDIAVTKRPRAPGSLTPTEKKLFNAIVAERPPDFFDSASVPMLIEYCRIPTQLDQVAEAIASFEQDWLKSDDGLKRYKDLVNLQDKAQKRIAALATKMRLAQQSRYDPTAARARPTKSTGPKPWEK